MSSRSVCCFCPCFLTFSFSSASVAPPSLRTFVLLLLRLGGVLLLLGRCLLLGRLAPGQGELASDLLAAIDVAADSGCGPGIDRAAAGARVLHYVGQFVGEHSLAGRRGRSELSPAEEDVVSGGERVRRDRAVELRRSLVIVYAYRAEVGGERRFHAPPHLTLQRRTGTARRLDRGARAGVEGPALAADERRAYRRRRGTAAQMSARRDRARGSRRPRSVVAGDAAHRRPSGRRRTRRDLPRAPPSMSRWAWEREPAEPASARRSSVSLAPLWASPRGRARDRSSRGLHLVTFSARRSC